MLAGAKIVLGLTFDGGNRRGASLRGPLLDKQIAVVFDLRHFGRGLPDYIPPANLIVIRFFR
jgi:hypothetical protein